MPSDHPTLLVFAGPNGSGKSTITSRFKPIGSYVNADSIQSLLSCSAMDAAIIAEQTREELLKESESFTFETVLSTERNINLMKRAKSAGYTVICVYVLTCDPKINISRVEQRVEKGGHDVPHDKIISRYHKALHLIPSLWRICDEIYIYDNSADRNAGEPTLIARKTHGVIEAFSSQFWTVDMLKELIAGSNTHE